MLAFSLKLFKLSLIFSLRNGKSFKPKILDISKSNTRRLKIINSTKYNKEYSIHTFYSFLRVDKPANILYWKECKFWMNNYSCCNAYKEDFAVELLIDSKLFSRFQYEPYIKSSRYFILKTTENLCFSKLPVFRVLLYFTIFILRVFLISKVLVVIEFIIFYC